MSTSALSLREIHQLTRAKKPFNFDVLADGFDAFPHITKEVCRRFAEFPFPHNDIPGYIRVSLLLALRALYVKKIELITTNRTLMRHPFIVTRAIQRFLKTHELSKDEWFRYNGDGEAAFVARENLESECNKVLLEIKKLTRKFGYHIAYLSGGYGEEDANTLHQRFKIIENIAPTFRIPPEAALFAILTENFIDDAFALARLLEKAAPHNFTNDLLQAMFDICKVKGFNQL